MERAFVTYYLIFRKLGINKNITLTGAGASSTVIEPASGSCIVIINGDVNINGFKIQDGNANVGGGIFNDGTLKISNSTISGNNANSGPGGIYSSSSEPADARNNWWGSNTGPTHSSNPGGTGDEISDNVDYDPWLTTPPGYVEPDGEDAEDEEIIIPWVRDHEMTCFQVWINEDNNFEFVFWWEYYNNNWVKIYDMEGNEVFSIDMEKGNAHFVAELPDGFYTVKTYHHGFETPIQEFLIGKP